MGKKKTYTIIGTAFLAGAILTTPLTSMAEQIYNRLTIQDAVKIMKEKDLQSQVVLEDEELKNMRTVFTPRDGYTPPHNDRASSWTAAYRTNVEPLRNQAIKDMDNYQILSGELQREAVSFTQAFNYWVMQEQKVVNQQNLNLAKTEYESAKKRFDLGMISQNDLMQVEMSYNNAQVTFDEAVKGFDQLKYQLNQKLDQRITQDIAVTATNFSFLPDNELNASAVVNQIFESHPSLNYVKKELQAYKKGQEVVNAESFIPANETLPIYLDREVKYWELRVRQQQQQLEAVTQGIIDDLKQLKKAVQLYETNAAKGESIYQAAVKRFEEGTTTFVDVDQARLNLLNTRLQLQAAKKDYMEQKEMFRLLKAGHIPQ